MKRIQVDLFVIGGGMAGMYAAIKAWEAGIKKVALATKGKLGKDSITRFAGGIFDVVTPDDDKEEEFRIRNLSDGWGTGLSDEEWLQIRLDEGYERLCELEKWGVEFEKTTEGKFERFPMKRKAKKVIFHSSQLAETMVKQVRKTGVEVINHTIVTDLFTKEGKPGKRVTGAVGFDTRTGEYKVFEAKAVVLATGGCGFKARFACHRMDTGEAVAMAYRAGAILQNFDITAFHTTTPNFDIPGLNLFQGFGGKFVNREGEEFLPSYDPDMGNMTGMTRLSQAITMEVKAGRGPIRLDMTPFAPEQVRKLRGVYPMATKILERIGVMVGDRIVKEMEWAPAFYGTIVAGGGVEVDTKCAASLPGLYVCGDAMARAKNFRSLVAAMVSGARAGKFVAEYIKKAETLKIDEKQVEELRKFTFAPLERGDGIMPDHIIIELQETLLPWETTIILREDRLRKALEEVERIRDEDLPMLYAPDPHYLRLANEVRSMVLVAEIQLRSLLLRKESRDSCLREDYPYTDNENWLKWIKVKQENGEMKLWAEDIKFKKVELRRGKFLHPVFNGANKRGIKWG